MNYKITVDLSEEEKALLEEAASRKKLSLKDYLLSCSLRDAAKQLYHEEIEEDVESEDDYEEQDYKSRRFNYPLSSRHWK